MTQSESEEAALAQPLKCLRRHQAKESHESDQIYAPPGQLEQSDEDDVIPHSPHIQLVERRTKQSRDFHEDACQARE